VHQSSIGGVDPKVMIGTQIKKPLPGKVFSAGAAAELF
jgi:hypothetical protein